MILTFILALNKIIYLHNRQTQMFKHIYFLTYFWKHACLTSKLITVYLLHVYK
jgi:hypothetical protein